jgi:hypothetical protein
MDEIECVTAAASMRAGERTCEPAQAFSNRRMSLKSEFHSNTE